MQDFYPTPGTASTVMYYTGINPLNMKKVYVTTDYHEKQLQRALLQYNRPQNASLVREALIKAGRTDLIGFGPECLVRPEKPATPAPKRPTGNKPTGGKKPIGARKPSTEKKGTARPGKARPADKRTSKPTTKKAKKR